MDDLTPDDDTELPVYPQWRAALKTLLVDGIEPGQIIPRARFVQLLGLREPVTAEDQIAFQFKWLQDFEALRAELLEEHRLDLRPVRREGAYQVTLPTAQTELAMGDVQRDMKRALRVAARRVSFVRTEELDDAQRKANADAQAKLAALAGMVRQPLLKGQP